MPPCRYLCEGRLVCTSESHILEPTLESVTSELGTIWRGRGYRNRLEWKLCSREGVDMPVLSRVTPSLAARCCGVRW